MTQATHSSDFCMLTPAASRWPPRLDGIRSPPAQVLVRGKVPDWSRMVAVVGTRASDPEGENFAYALGAALSRAGYVVLSGGARGIDSAAHLGALSESGATVAVLATGLDQPYPRSNAQLFDQISVHGALISEVHGEVPPHPGRFLRRNVLVAALAKLIVVVQAPNRSGALATARAARRLGRPVLVVPAAPWDVRGRGGLGLIAKGAEVCVDIRTVLNHPSLVALTPSGTSGGANATTPGLAIRVQRERAGPKPSAPSVQAEQGSQGGGEKRTKRVRRERGAISRGPTLGMEHLPTVLRGPVPRLDLEGGDHEQRLRCLQESARQRAQANDPAAGLVWRHWRP